MDEIRKEAIAQEDFDFMTETERTEVPGNDGGKPQPDELQRVFDLGLTSREEALRRMIAFAQEDGWSPDPRSAGTPPAQLKPLDNGSGLRLIVLATDDVFILTVEAPHL